MEKDRGYFEKLSTEQRLDLGFQVSSKAFNIALNLLDGRDNPRYDHLKRVVDPSRVVIMSDEQMKLYAEVNGVEYSGATYYRGSKGFLEKDTIGIAKSDVHPMVILHEFIHRASNLYEGKTETSFDQIFKLTGIRNLHREELPREEWMSKLYLTFGYKNFSEGIAQWATMFLYEKVLGRNPIADYPYEFEKHSVDHIMAQDIESRGYSQEERRLLMLDLALTGDHVPFNNVLGSEPITEGIYPVSRSLIDFYKSVNSHANNNARFNHATLDTDKIAQSKRGKML